MKILIVNASDINGGAARAAYRLHKSLLEQGVDSEMLVQNKSGDDYTVKSIAKNKFQKGIAKLRPTLDAIPVKFYKNKTETLFSPAVLPFSGVVDEINRINPNIVHLHWINRGMIRIEELSKIKAPIVWSLHDNWAFTGGCHIKLDCNQYKISCGNCPRLGSDKGNDLSRSIWNRKKKTFDKLDNLTIVGLSNWVNNCSKESSLLQSKNHINIPNPLNTKIFKPFYKNKSRELWSLPENKKLVLFGAMNATSDINKGFSQLSEAIKKIDVFNVDFVVFGSSKPKNAQDLGCNVHYIGCLADDISLITLYSAVDVMVVPSIQEAFGQTASEAMSCQTPVVAFAHTGLLDIVEHKKNGYLAKPLDTTDLANGIEWVLNNKSYDELCKNAREKVLKEFDSKIVAKKYINLYREILRNAL